MAELALRFVARTRRQSDQQPSVFFEGTQLDWRDDNRHLWRFIEDGDEEDTQATPRNDAPHELHSLPPRLYPEWDCHSQSERPDWVKVYEYLHPSGHASDIDRLLDQHSGLRRRLQKVLDRLKPQGRERLRRLEQGSELDLDLAQQALIDLRSGHTPDVRVQQHWRSNSRDVSVQLVMDLSASLAERVPGSEHTVLQVSQAAVAILGWTLAQLGDALALGGFHSNTRQEVRYMHLKGFNEPWGADVKARLAAMEPAYSTRLGAALRHGARPLVQRASSRKLLLVLTDGEPADVDVSDPDYLAQDARQVVRELEAQGVFVWCIQLHPAHEESVRTVFGEHYTLVDRIERLPQVLAGLFLRLTR
jgi:nitric oxide reductase activation protein